MSWRRIYLPCPACPDGEVEVVYADGVCVQGREIVAVPEASDCGCEWGDDWEAELSAHVIEALEDRRAQHVEERAAERSLR